MSIQDDTISNTVDSSEMERVHYFPRQLITASDMIQEQEYFRERLRRHNRFLHGWGVVCGLEVTASPTQDKPWMVTILPGFALSPQGDEIYVRDPFTVDLAQSYQKAYSDCESRLKTYSDCESGLQITNTAKPERTLFAVVIKYAECLTRPVRVAPTLCGCDETVCEYSRIRDSFEVECLTPPKGVSKKGIQQLLEDRVVLAKIQIEDTMTKIDDNHIEDNRVFNKASTL